MDFRTYQMLARRTQNPVLTPDEKRAHALCGLASEIGEIMSLHQHQIQDGRRLDRKELAKEIGDVEWFIAELCDCYNMQMDAIAFENIEKLKKRYPDGFDEERSIHRHDYDTNADA